MIFSLPAGVAALIAGTFTWSLTAVGAALVFFINKMNDKVTSVTSGLAAGIMLSASFWSLLLPAKQRAEQWGGSGLVPLTVGFLSGGLFIVLSGLFFEHVSRSGMGFHIKSDDSEHHNKGLRSALIMLAITMHNIPEGLAVGVAIGAAAASPDLSAAAVVLTLGIGLQNLPEGAAISLPLRREGTSKLRSFMYGQMSALVEPVFAVIGAMLSGVAIILPFALSFAAGAMVFVIAQELIPESVKTPKHGIWSLMIGFTLMTLLDVAFG